MPLFQDGRSFLKKVVQGVTKLVKFLEIQARKQGRKDVASDLRLILDDVLENQKGAIREQKAEGTRKRSIKELAKSKKLPDQEHVKQIVKEAMLQLQALQTHAMVSRRLWSNQYYHSDETCQQLHPDRKEV